MITLGLCATGASTLAAEIYVAVDGSDVAGDGSRGAPFATVQHAIGVAVSGTDAVVLLPGIYTGPGNRDIDFGGKAITVRSEAGPTLTIIDAEQMGRGFLFQSGEGRDSILQGLTITGGLHAPVDGTPARGGGIFIEGASPIIRDCIISGNAAVPARTNQGGTGQPGQGGGVYCGLASATFENCEIRGNSAVGGVFFPNLLDVNGGDGFGGGIYAIDSTITLSGCFLDGNTAASPTVGAFGQASTGEASGGAVYALTTTLTFIDCAVTRNLARPGDAGAATAIATTGLGFGGGLYIYGCIFRMIRGRVEGNRAEGALGSSPGAGTTISTSAFGGAMVLIRCPLAEFVDTSISGNEARGDTRAIGGGAASVGGGIAAGISNIRLIRCVVSNNIAFQTSNVVNRNFGGGVLVTDCDILFDRSTISGNDPSGLRTGGAIGTGFLLSCTVVNNTGFQGGAMASSADPIRLRNTIVANPPGSPNFPFINATPPLIVSDGYNISSDDSFLLGAPGDMVNTDPLLGPLADNGGPTMTHALLVGSPAIDAADSAANAGADQRGFARPIDGDGDGTALPDIGAFEFQSVRNAAGRWARYE